MKNFIRNIKKQVLRFRWIAKLALDLKYHYILNDINLQYKRQGWENTVSQNKRDILKRYYSIPLKERPTLNSLVNATRFVQPATIITNTKKPRSNNPCICGSGDKYKKCCGKKSK